MYDQVPREVFLAAWAEGGEEPDWKSEYAKLYRKYAADRYHKRAVEELRSQLPESDAQIHFTIRVRDGKVQFEFEAHHVNYGGWCFGFEHSTVAEAAECLLKRIEEKKKAIQKETAQQPSPAA